MLPQNMVRIMVVDPNTMMATAATTEHSPDITMMALPARLALEYNHCATLVTKSVHVTAGFPRVQHKKNAASAVSQTMLKNHMLRKSMCADATTTGVVTVDAPQPLKNRPSRKITLAPAGRRRIRRCGRTVRVNGTAALPPSSRLGSVRAVSIKFE